MVPGGNWQRRSKASVESKKWACNCFLDCWWGIARGIANCDALLCRWGNGLLLPLRGSAFHRPLCCGSLESNTLISERVQREQKSSGSMLGAESAECGKAEKGRMETGVRLWGGL